MELTQEQLEARDSLWELGELSFLLRPSQVVMYENIKSWLAKPIKDRSLKYVINSTRRFGKTTVLCLLMLEYHLKNREEFYPTPFTAPTAKALRKIVRPIFRQLLKTCPEHLKPVWKTQEQHYIFPWGGEIPLAGLNNGHEDDARGTAAGLAVVDEAGMVDELAYVCEDILMPQLLTTNGSMIISSTPPPTPDHAFMTYVQVAQLSGDYSEYTIRQTDFTQEVIDKYISESGGLESSSCQREYFCKFVVDKNFAICPEWQDTFGRAWKRDQFFTYYHYYEGMDIGGKDFNACLFGYYDFEKAVLVIEDEVILTINEMTSRAIADTTFTKEEELGLLKSRPVIEKQEVIKPGEWTKKVHCRVADTNNVILLQDLGAEYGLHFAPTSKDELVAMVNKLRVWTRQGRLVVNPKCKQTIGCLKYGVWNNAREHFAKSESFGHFDAIAALIYLVRNVDEATNPIPAHLGKTANDFHINEQVKSTRQQKELLKIFPGLRRD